MPPNVIGPACNHRFVTSAGSMPGSLRAILLDLDDTLIPTRKRSTPPWWQQAVSDYPISATQRGWPVTFARLRAKSGAPLGVGPPGRDWDWLHGSCCGQLSKARIPSWLQSDNGCPSSGSRSGHPPCVKLGGQARTGLSFRRLSFESVARDAVATRRPWTCWGGFVPVTAWRS